MTKIIFQFGYKRGTPAEHVPLVDCRVIPNPYHLRGPAAIRAAVREHRHFEALVRAGVKALDTHDAVGIGCMFGVHRSGAVAEEVAKRTGATIIFGLSEDTH